jgi:hypothetical protein
MLELMEANVLFNLEYRPMHSTRDHDPPGVAALVEHGFDIEVLEDRIEWLEGDEGIYEWRRKVFVRARITREIDPEAPDPQGDFLEWVFSIVEPFDGDWLEAGFADPHFRLRSHASVTKPN